MWRMVRGMLPQGVWVMMQTGTLQNFRKQETLMVLQWVRNQMELTAKAVIGRCPSLPN